MGGLGRLWRSEDVRKNAPAYLIFFILYRLPRYVYMDDILSRFKRKERGSSSSDSETSPQGKRVCSEEPDEILVALDMSKDIGVKLQQVLDKLGEMDKKIESVMANVAKLEKTMTNIQSEVSSLKVRADSAETKLKEMDTGLQFANGEVEDLKTQSRNTQQCIESLKERLLYQEVYNRRENLRFFGLPESTESTIEDSSEVLYRFLERDLDIEGARSIEFQRVHRLGRKKAGTSRPIIARFLRYPDRERVFKAALEAQDEIGVKVYADLPKEIQENRKKQWPRLKRAREEGKIAYFSRKEPDKLFIEGRFVAS